MTKQLSEPEMRKKKNLIEAGKRLKNFRLSKKLTLEELSEKTGITYQLLTKAENGKHNLTMVELINLRKCYGIDFIYLFDDLP
jgi:transcriptional regulator with XRE-family HTH domain